MLLIFRWRRKRKEIWFLCLLTLRQKVLWRITLKLLVEVRKKNAVIRTAEKDLNFRVDHKWTWMKNTALFSKANTKGRCVLCKSSCSCHWAYAVILSCVTAQPRKFPRSPLITEPAASPSEYDSDGSWKIFWSSGSCYHKVIFLEWGDSVGPWERKGGEWEMGIWALISVLLLVPRWLWERPVVSLASMTYSVKWSDRGMTQVKVCCHACKYWRIDSCLPACLSFPSAKWGTELELRGSCCSNTLWLCWQHLFTLPTNTPVRLSL